MTRKLSKILAVVGIGSVTLFQAGSCDTLANSFVQGLEMGYQAETGESLIGSLLGSGGSSGDSSWDDSAWVDDWDYSECDYYW